MKMGSCAIDKSVKMGSCAIFSSHRKIELTGAGSVHGVAAANVCGSGFRANGLQTPGNGCGGDVSSAQVVHSSGVRPEGIHDRARREHALPKKETMGKSVIICHTHCLAHCYGM